MNARQLFRPLVGIVGLVALVGCIPSLRPIYTNDDIVFDPAIVGEWSAEGGSTWVFTKRDDNAYRLMYTEKDGKQGRFTAHLAQVGDVRFLDLYPEQAGSKEEADFHRVHYVPIHTVYLVRSTKPSLELVAIDLGWLSKHLKQHPDALDHVGDESRFLITAPTKDLQKFLIDNLDRFTGEIKLERSPDAT